MRTPGPVKEVRHIGLLGEELAARLNTLKANNPRHFNAIEKGLHTLLPTVEGIDTEVSNLGEVELFLKENQINIPARVLSEGTLRMLGLLALTGSEEPPSLVGFEEPENGVHPGRIDLIAEFLKTRQIQGSTQYIVTTHSPRLLDTMPPESLFATRQRNRKTRITPLLDAGPLWNRVSVRDSLEEDGLTISERVVRGDFND